MSIDDAVNQTVDECIEEGILRDFLLENKAEVKRMSIFEYNEKATRKAIRKVERELGREEGRTEGRTEALLVILEEMEAVPEDIRETILAQTDLEVLKLWLKSAAKAESLEEWKVLVGWRE